MVLKVIIDIKILRKNVFLTLPSLISKQLIYLAESFFFCFQLFQSKMSFVKDVIGALIRI